MMSRILYTKIWKDEFVAELNPTEKLLFIYFITNERVNIIHCYEVSDREIAFDTGMDRGIITRAKEKFQQAQKISFYKNYVLLRNADKYESYKGEKNELAKDKLESFMSQDVLDWYNNVLDRGIDTPLMGSINHKSEIINQNKGVVKGITAEDIYEIANMYEVPTAFVKSKWDDIENYCASTGKKYKDYKATLRNWVKRDALKLKERSIYDDKKRGIDATQITTTVGSSSREA